MTNDDLIPIVNIATMTFCAFCAAVWWPLFKKSLACIGRFEVPTKLPLLGMGIFCIALSTSSVRLYSFFIREFEQDWLRFHPIAFYLIFFQCISFGIFSIGYFSPRDSGVSENNTMNTQSLVRGSIAALIVLISMIALKYFF